MKKILMIFNPRAGKNSVRQKHDHILRVFKEYGFAVTEKTTTCVGDATEIVKHNLKGHEAVVCCGGDGTLNETINGLMALGQKVPIMYLPMGSTNDLANTIGVSTDAEKAVEMYLDGSINSYDIGTFNDNHFTYVASFGVGTDIAYTTSQKLKNIFGHTAYILNGFIFNLPNEFKSLKPHHMVIEYDGGVIDDEFYFGAVSNSNRVAGLFSFNKRGIKLNDGVFEVILVRKLKRKVEAFYLLKKIMDEDYDGEKIIFFRTSHLKIKSDEDLPWTLDGEFGGNHFDIDIGIKKEAINLVSPSGDLFIPRKQAAVKENEEDVFFEELQESSKEKNRDKSKEKVKK